jgi:hypothetical protein
VCANDGASLATRVELEDMDAIESRARHVDVVDCCDADAIDALFTIDGIGVIAYDG